MAIKKQKYRPDQATLLVRTFFGVELPVSADELKTAFRTKSLELHPDKGGDAEKFIEMKDVYDFLVSLPDVFTRSDENPSVKCRCATDGTPLYELGLGLGPTKNGRDCPRCGRKGYTVRHGTSYTVCEECNELGMVPRKVKVDCKYCKGSGKFTQRNSRRVVDCLACGGSGKFEKIFGRSNFGFGAWEFCPKCLGTKTIFSENEKEFYEKCYECGGIGEIRIYNPVIPKGVLTSISAH